MITKNRLPYRAIHLSVFLVASLLLGGQAFACLSPSMIEMREGRAMACCAEHCRVETTHQAAQQACQQSDQVLTQHEAISSQAPALALDSANMPPNSVLSFQTVQDDDDHAEPKQPARRDHPPQHPRTVAIYTLIHAYLI